jgi:hypothetical protein
MCLSRFDACISEDKVGDGRLYGEEILVLALAHPRHGQDQCRDSKGVEISSTCIQKSWTRRPGGLCVTAYAEYGESLSTKDGSVSFRAPSEVVCMK